MFFKTSKIQHNKRKHLKSYSEDLEEFGTNLEKYSAILQSCFSTVRQISKGIQKLLHTIRRTNTQGSCQILQKKVKQQDLRILIKIRADALKENIFQN